MSFPQKLVTTNVHAVNCRDVDGRHSTPLHFAAGYNRVAVVEYLLEHGADVHAKDKGYVSLSFSLSLPLSFSSHPNSCLCQFTCSYVPHELE